MITLLIAQTSFAQHRNDLPAVRVARPEMRAPLSDQQLDALLEFRWQHLEVRAFERQSPGVTWVSPGWGWGRPGWGGWATVVTSPPVIREEWAVYQGPKRLAVPRYLEMVGDRSGAEQLARRIRGNRSTGSVLGGLALMGLVGGLGGITASLVDEPVRRDQWTTIGLGSFGGALLSGILSATTHHRADKLASDYGKTQDIDQVESEVREFNERLREELGLTADQAYRELAPR